MPEPDLRTQGWHRWLGWPTAAALAVVHIALAMSSARLESSTFDEGLQLTAGYANWLTGDQRLHAGNGPLPQLWFALPLVLDGERFTFPDPDRVIASQEVDDFHELTHFLAHVFFYEVGNDPAEILLRSRAMAALLGAALCGLVYAWARRLWGSGAGVLACALCALSPNVLAHARLATSDLMFAVLLVASLGLVWRSFWRPSLAIALAAGAALGALALTKLSAIGAIGMIAILLALRALWPVPLPWRRGRRLAMPGQRAVALLMLLALQGAAAVTLIWAVYGFRYDIVPEGMPGREAVAQQWVWVHERDGPGLDAIDALRSLHALPEGFLFSAAFVLRHSEERSSFFRGKTGIGGDWRFFPYALAVKTPLALFGLIALAGLAARRAPPGERRRLAAVGAPLVVLLAVHGLLAMTSEINLGLRHVLPLYPALFVLAGGAASAWLGGAARTTAVALGVGFAAASASIWPHYLAYFNLLVGPENGYRVLVDSSLDWGQDLDSLQRDLSERPGHEPVYLSYFGSADPMFHDLDVRLLPGFFDWATIQHREARADLDWTLEPGLYAISATMLQQPWARVPREWTPAQHADYARLGARFQPLERAQDPAAALRAALGDRATRKAWLDYRALRLSRLCQVLREREPDWQIGHSILVYRVTEDELGRVVAR
ncbi:MAG: phospholipid carrier-dependent glycosyltransferase [Myxococcota bacterium]|nr:phospholipid carrier-dependent glycosyltransferase [Myxococcota bacterium]